MLNPSVLGLIVLTIMAQALVVAIVLCGGSLLRKRRLPEPVRRPQLRWFGAFVWLISPIVVAATFGGISAMETSMINGPDTIQTASQLPPKVASKPAGPIPVNPVPLEDRTSTSSADGLSQRPAWVEVPRTVDGVCERISLASQQYTTREEAEQELSARALELLRNDLQKLYPGASPQSVWCPTNDDLRRIAIKRHYVEVVDRDFGNFFSPMYRVWWQLELSPEVRMEFLPAWRRGLTTNRVHLVGIVVTSMALIIGLAAVVSRFGSQTRGAG